jgi:hypothetical protein
MEITTGTRARLFGYMEITTGTRARLFDYMEIITGTRARLFDYMGSLKSLGFGVIVFSLWVYDMVHQKSRYFLLKCYKALLWLQIPPQFIQL